MIQQVAFLEKGAFFGKKSSAFKIAIETEEYAQVFSDLGNELDVPSSAKAVLKKLVCHLYGVEDLDDVNLVRYLLFKEGNLKRNYCHQMRILWISM